MTDISYCNTKEGIHESAKKEGLRAWALGCSCDECEKEFSKIMGDVSDKKPMMTGASNYIDHNGESYVKTSYAIEQMHACSKESISLTALFVLKWTKDLELYESIMDIGISK